jgi:2,4-dienoyl-CoA reductase (NADPH2)
VEQLDKIGMGLGPGTRWVILKELQKANVRTLTGSYVKEIKKGGVVFNKDNKEKFMEADTVVMATGSEIDTSLYDNFKDLAPEVYMAGIGTTVGHTIESIGNAFDLSMKI